MPRALSKNEQDYVARLVARNDELEEEDEMEKGLETPMPAKERAMRTRIRKKAEKMVMDLVFIEAAGIWPAENDEDSCLDEAVTNAAFGFAMATLDRPKPAIERMVWNGPRKWNFG